MGELWIKEYEVTGVNDGSLTNATLAVMKCGELRKLVISNDANYDGQYAAVSVKTGPFTLIQFAEIEENEHFEFKPGSDAGVIYVTPEGVAIVTE